MKRLIPVVMIDGTTIFHRFSTISPRKPRPSLVAGCWIILCFVSPVFPAEAVPPAQVNAFLHTYYVRCHSPEEQQAKVRIERELTEPGFAAHWGRVLGQLTTGKMPPKDEKQPPPEKRAAKMQLPVGLDQEQRFSPTGCISTSESVAS